MAALTTTTTPSTTPSSTALQRWQAATGVLVALFVTLHLLNTWLASFGPAFYNPVQEAFGTVYQWPALEAVLLASIYVHLGIGITRIIREPKRTLTPRARWHRYSGVFLALVITGHIGAVRGASFFADVWPRFEGIAFTLEFLPQVFLPYYLLLATAGFYHALNGMALALPRLSGLRPRLSTPVLRGATAFAALASLSALCGFAGVYFDVGDVMNSDFGQLTLDIIGANPTP